MTFPQASSSPANLSNSSSILTKEEFIKGISPVCEDLAMDQFVGQHHRAPSPAEMKHLTKQLVLQSVEMMETKMGRSLHAKGLLEEFLPKLFSKEESDLVMVDFQKGEAVFKDVGEMPLDKSLQDVLGIPLENLRKCFDVGKQLFENERYGDAETIFEMLVHFNPKFSIAWLDLGFCLHEQGKLQEALQAYAATYFLDPKPVYARAKSIEAYLSLGQKADAEAEYDELEQIVNTSPDASWSEILSALAKKLGEAK